MQEFLDQAKAAAEDAAAIIREHYDRAFDVQYKSDASPVTEVDIASERAIRARLEAAFPDHGFYGEELGQAQPDADYLWLIDPIDGTKSFVRHYPVFSTQIALMHKGELVLGVSSAPVYGQLAWAVKGEGAYMDGKRIAVDEAKPLARSILSTGNLNPLLDNPTALAKLAETMRGAHRHRGYGDFLHYHLLASGSIDMICEAEVNILDIAALTVIVREAGGVMTDLKGGEIGLDTTTVAAANSEQMHQLLLEIGQSL